MVHIDEPACRHGVTPVDVALVLGNPIWTMSMPDLHDIGLGELERPNVTVYGGLAVSRNKLVVFVDRFEGVAFHSEPGLPKYAELFGDS